MSFDLDPLDDILSAPAASNARAGDRFQPKAKSRPKIETFMPVCSSLPNASTEKHIMQACSGLDTMQSVQTVDATDNNLINPGICSLTTSKQVNFLSESHVTRIVESSNSMHSDVAIPDSSGFWHSSIGKSVGENADIFFELECLDDDFLSQSTSVLEKSQLEVDQNVQPGNEFPISYPVNIGTEGSFPSSEMPTLNASGVKNAEGEPDILGQRTGKFQPRPMPKVQSERKQSRPTVSDPDIVESDLYLQDGQLVPPETENIDGVSVSVRHDDVIDFSSVRFGDSIPTDPTSELLVDEEQRNPLETSHPNSATAGYNMHSAETGGKNAKSMEKKSLMVSDASLPKIFTLSEDNKTRESSRRRSKRIAACSLVNEYDEGHDGDGSHAGTPSCSLIIEDNNDDEYRVESKTQKKRGPRTSKQSVAENEKTVRKRKKTTEVPEQSTTKPSKKFSHSTRRNRRCVDKVLLETPEDELDRQNLRLKDLILIAEYKERLANKEAATSKMSSTNQSANNNFPEDASYNEEESFSEPGRGSMDEENIRVQEDSSYFNYQSYMDKLPIARWSKQETELFYEAVRQFGSDISMIQQLFPGRTRRQVKLKYKKEERQHPFRLNDALRNRAIDHSHFEQVIERLRQAATVEKQNSNRDDSVDITNEDDEVEAVVLETNEEVAKPEQKERDSVKNLDADVADVQSPVNSHDSEDDFFRWSQYKSEI